MFVEEGGVTGHEAAGQVCVYCRRFISKPEKLLSEGSLSTRPSSQPSAGDDGVKMSGRC